MMLMTLLALVYLVIKLTSHSLFLSRILCSASIHFFFICPFLSFYRHVKPLVMVNSDHHHHHHREEEEGEYFSLSLSLPRLCCVDWFVIYSSLPLRLFLSSVSRCKIKMFLPPSSTIEEREKRKATREKRNVYKRVVCWIDDGGHDRH